MEKDNLTYIKAKMRKEYLEKRNLLSSKDVEQYSMIISEKILSHPSFVNAKTIMAYIPFRNEVDIRLVIEKAWAIGKQILVPKTEPKIKKIEPYLISSWEDLELGHFNVYEPITLNKKPFNGAEIDLVLVPGVAFDKKGYRLGYGGGYYDRFFNHNKMIQNKIGIAYDFQILEQLPIDNHDYPVKELITEKRNIKIG
ncbi:5-formyltetrahydrofolate cyclo-ligase [Vulcanibacillus modesticaldus]|uniref:5-formyltetrahydrofolate cyclo-ligase n=1 Tax=Vulcanibacillus modesticaldus TaxID=337097 RepID=A0A1D2YX95_9BACI|nr:5-formyltetrahydrofolate cyclo-ligase [Vulcanibacillus modesticaldus]OEG00263.1 5-formyltetrahydrofolate cyclo-ligase [Vulcanibacillus modesticaldus]